MTIWQTVVLVKMVLVKCEEIAVHDNRTLKQWLIGTKEVSIDKVPFIDLERKAMLKIKDESGKEISFGPASLSHTTLRRLGCRTAEDAVDVFDRCRVTISSDKHELAFEFVNREDLEIELKIDHFPKKVVVAKNIGASSEAIFGSAKEALDDLDERDAMDSVYSHIPIKIGNCTKYVDLREVGDDFCEDIDFLCEFDLETYYRSLTFWIDWEREGVLPFRRENDTTLLLPVPPATKVSFKEFHFTEQDLHRGDAIRPSTQYGDWKQDVDNGFNYCMAHKGQPLVYDSLQRRIRRLVLWQDLKKEAFDRLVQECGWPVHKATSFTKSFEASFRFTRCMFSYNKDKGIWTATVPEVMGGTIDH